jgi:hypothetical protein
VTSLPSSPDPDDDDIHWADPAIRTAYEAALGQFILAFNEVDYRVSQVIRLELTRRGHSDLAATACNGRFAQRLETLAMLATSEGGHLGATPLARLRSLNTHRNNLAHGHFDQNPFDGSYKLALNKKIGDYPTERMLTLTSELTQIAEQLRSTEVLYAFDINAKDGV